LSMWRAALVALVLVAGSLPAQAMSLDEIRQYLLELRGRAQQWLVDPGSWIAQLQCGELRPLGAAPLPPMRDATGCWYRLPMQDGVVEFQYTVSALRADAGTVDRVAEQARRASELRIRGQRVALEAEEVSHIESERFGRMAWLESAKQLVYLQGGRLVSVRFRGSEGGVAYAAQVADLLADSRR
jgi:hypothetical protein